MARQPRIAAHLGRPETPAEAAARKAENSRRYRQSKSFRNLIIALVVSLAIVAVVYLGVPRGELADPPAPDAAGTAAQISEQMDRTIVVPKAPDGWGMNVAELETGAPIVWTINYNGIPGADRSFLRFAQGLDVTDAWAPQMLGGARATDTVTVDGIEWTAYEATDAASNRNISYALGVQAGADHLLLYGQVDAETAAELAGALGDDVRTLREESSE